MEKKAFLVLACLGVLLMSISASHGQDSKRSMTLPSGEVVCDLNGDWDAVYDHPGLGKWTDILRVTQRGSSFEGVKTIGSPYVPKNALALKGELSKDGITKVQVVMRILYSGESGKMTERPQFADCKGQMSEDGNRIVVDGGEIIKVTLTRK